MGLDVTVWGGPGYMFFERRVVNYSLKEDLAEHGIYSFDGDFVQNYMSKAERVANKFFHFANSLRTPLIFAGLVFAFLAALPALSDWTFITVPIAGLCVLAVLSLTWLKSSGLAVWKTYNLSAYQGVIPNSVREKIAKVRSVAPEAKGYIHELRVGERIDPIVEFCDYSGVVAVAIWDENGVQFPSRPENF